MIDEIIQRMSELVKNLQKSIELDIEDIKNAKHESLLSRNDEKHSMINEITELKAKLNQELITKIQEGVDVNIYREKVDFLEVELKNLYDLNKRLASVVLPVQQMYKELVEEITAANGGNIFDVKA
jgi:predicted  nucleic acid-binding Zn-ribbon protein